MRRSRAFAACALIATVADAHAAPPVAPAQAKDAFADCLVRRQPQFASAWLEVLPGSPEEKALIAASRKDFDACVGKSGVVIDEAATSHSSLRGPVAARLLAGRLAALPAAAPVAPDTPPWFTDTVIAAPDAVMDRGELRTEFFAHCVVLRQWPETLAFLGTRGADPSAIAAMRLLGPALGACLTEGTTVAFRPATLRPMLANAVYHVAAMPAARSAPALRVPPATRAPRAAPAAPAGRPAPAAPAAPVAPTLPYATGIF